MMTLLDFVRADTTSKTAYQIKRANNEGDFYAPGARSLEKFMFDENIDPSKLVVNYFEVEELNGRLCFTVYTLGGF